MDPLAIVCWTAINLIIALAGWRQHRAARKEREAVERRQAEHIVQLAEICDEQARAVLAMYDAQMQQLAEFFALVDYGAYEEAYDVLRRARIQPKTEKAT